MDKRASKRRPSAIPVVDDFEDVVLDFAWNLLVASLARRHDKAWIRWLSSHEIIDKVFARRASTKVRKSRATRRIARDTLRSATNARVGTSIPRPLPDSIGRNLRWLSKSIGLSESEQLILQFAALVDADRPLAELADAFPGLERTSVVRVIAAATTLSEASVMSALRSEGRLLGSGLISVRPDMYGFSSKLDVKSGLLDALMEPALDKRKLLARFLPEAPAGTLDWSDVEHLGTEASMARDILKAALQHRTAGVNILLHGPPGTGKTELASLLAKELDVPLFVALEGAQLAASEAAKERLSSFTLGQRLLQGGAALLMFDELEDLFSWNWLGIDGDQPQGVASMSKQTFNTVLETNPIPAIWITNQVRGIDHAFLRRFMFAIEFPDLGMRQRARILTRHLGDPAPFATPEVSALAARFTLSPAQYAMAVRAARLVGVDDRPELSALQRFLTSQERLVRKQPQALMRDASQYDVGVINASEDARALADQLANWQPNGRAGLSILLHGPPGTGKSEYIRHVAHRMGRPVLHRSASDILASYVGETERRIAEAFKRAEQDGAVLLFDEVDSFLRNRIHARQSWEVTQVNEFLQRLEAYTGVVACTTNLSHDMDAAAWRRFAIKMEFRYLTTDQAVACFRFAFAGVLAAPMTESDEANVVRALGARGTLAPGDFAIVSRRLLALGRTASVDELLTMLVIEVRSKARESHRIGF